MIFKLDNFDLFYFYNEKLLQIPFFASNIANMATSYIVTEKNNEISTA